MVRHYALNFQIAVDSGDDQEMARYLDICSHDIRRVSDTMPQVKVDGAMRGGHLALT